MNVTAIDTFASTDSIPTHSFHDSSSYKKRKPVPPELVETPTSPKPPPLIMQPDKTNSPTSRKRASSTPTKSSHKARKHRDTEVLLRSTIAHLTNTSARLSKTEAQKKALQDRLTSMESQSTPKRADSASVSAAMLRQQQSETIAAQEAARQFRLRLQETERELEMTRETMRSIEDSRENAEREARKARTAARKFKTERDMMKAREEGWNRGIQEGQLLAHQLITDGYAFSRTSVRRIEGGSNSGDRPYAFIEEVEDEAPTGRGLHTDEDMASSRRHSRSTKRRSERTKQRTRATSLDSHSKGATSTRLRSSPPHHASATPRQPSVSMPEQRPRKVKHSASRKAPTQARHHLPARSTRNMAPEPVETPTSSYYHYHHESEPAYPPEVPSQEVPAPVERPRPRKERPPQPPVPPAPQRHADPVMPPVAHSQTPAPVQQVPVEPPPTTSYARFPQPTSLPPPQPPASVATMQSLPYMPMPTPPANQAVPTAPSSFRGAKPTPQRIHTGHGRHNSGSLSSATGTVHSMGMDLLSFPVGTGKARSEQIRRGREIARRKAELEAREIQAEMHELELRSKTLDRLEREQIRRSLELRRKNLEKRERDLSVIQESTDSPTTQEPSHPPPPPRATLTDADRRRSVEEWRRHTIPQPAPPEENFLGTSGGYLPPGSSRHRRDSDTSSTSSTSSSSSSGVGIVQAPSTGYPNEHRTGGRISVPPAPGEPPVIPSSFADAAFGHPGAQLPVGFVPTSPFPGQPATPGQPAVAFPQPTIPPIVPPPGSYMSLSPNVTGGQPILQPRSRSGGRPGTPGSALITPQQSYVPAPFPPGVGYPPPASTLAPAIPGQTPRTPLVSMPSPQVDGMPIPVIPGRDTSIGGTPRRRSISLGPGATPSSITSSLPAANFPSDRQLRHTSLRRNGPYSSSSESSSGSSSTSSSGDTEDDGIDRFDETTTANTLANSKRGYTPMGNPIGLPPFVR